MICLAVILGEPWGDFVSGCSQWTLAAWVFRVNLFFGMELRFMAIRLSKRYDLLVCDSWGFYEHAINFI